MVSDATDAGTRYSGADLLEKVKPMLLDSDKLRLFTCSDLEEADPKDRWEEAELKDAQLREASEQVRQAQESREFANDEAKEAAVKSLKLLKWQLANRPVVCEYLLFMDEEHLRILQPENAHIVRKCSRKTDCTVLLTNRIVNRQIGCFKSVKYVVMQIQGPDFTMVQMCCRMLARWFPEFEKRIEYKSTRIRVSMAIREDVPDNQQLYFSCQRGGCTRKNFGQLECQLPVAGGDSASSLQQQVWASELRAGSLPNAWPLHKQQSYAMPWHPLGPPAVARLVDSRTEAGRQTKSDSVDKDRGKLLQDRRQRLGGRVIVSGLTTEAAEEEKRMGIQPDDTAFEDPKDMHKDLEHLREILSAFENDTYLAQLAMTAERLNNRLKSLEVYSDLVPPYPKFLRPVPMEAVESASSKPAGRWHRPRTFSSLMFYNEDIVFAEYQASRRSIFQNAIIPYPKGFQPGIEVEDEAKYASSYVYRPLPEFLYQRSESLSKVWTDMEKFRVDMTPMVAKINNRAIAKFKDYKYKVICDGASINREGDARAIFDSGKVNCRNVDFVLPNWRLVMELNVNQFLLLSDQLEFAWQSFRSLLRKQSRCSVTPERGSRKKSAETPKQKLQRHQKYIESQKESLMVAIEEQRAQQRKQMQELHNETKIV